MQRNLDDAQTNMSQANTYLMQSKEHIKKVDLKNINTARNHTNNQSRVSTYNNNLRLGLKENDFDNNYLTQSTAFATNYLSLNSNSTQNNTEHRSSQLRIQRKSNLNFIKYNRENIIADK